MSDRTRPCSALPAVAGVYESDPFCPPAPPIGARAVETRDASGRVIGFGWAAPEHAEMLGPTAWEWHAMTTRHASLRLVK